MLLAQKPAISVFIQLFSVKKKSINSYLVQSKNRSIPMVFRIQLFFEVLFSYVITASWRCFFFICYEMQSL